MSKSGKFNLTLVFVICLLCVLCCGSALADEAADVSYTETPVYVDGMLSNRGYTMGGVTYVSLESVSSVLGYDAVTDYNLDTNILTVSVAGIEITAEAGRQYMQANGRAIYLPYGYKEINGSYAFPVDAVAKIFTLNVSYDGESVNLEQQTKQFSRVETSSTTRMTFTGCPESSPGNPEISPLQVRLR